MQNRIEIINKKSSVEINIEGTIGVPETWQFDDPQERVATYDKFRNALSLIRQLDAPEVVVNIRSTGGDVQDALLMYEALSTLTGRCITRCYGYVASAATIIAQAATAGCREISAHALYLIHQAACSAEGNAEELAARLELLHKTDERIAALYAARSGREAEEFAALMAENNGEGRWLSPQETVAAGLADTIINEPAVCNFTVVDEKENTLISNTMIKIKNVYSAILRRLNLTPENDASETEISEEQLESINAELEEAEQLASRVVRLEQELADEKAAHEATRQALSEVQNRVQFPEADIARKQAQPTQTKRVEDPPVSEEMKLASNARAYAEDVKNFK